MNWRIETVSDFDVEAKRLYKKYRSLPSDLRTLQKELLHDPYSGVEIMPNVRKVRMAIASKGKGKSGGARIITYIAAIDEDKGVIYLLCIYDKSDISNIKKDSLAKLMKELGFLDSGK